MFCGLCLTDPPTRLLLSEELLSSAGTGRVRAYMDGMLPCCLRLFAVFAVFAVFVVFVVFAVFVVSAVSVVLLCLLCYQTHRYDYTYKNKSSKTKRLNKCNNDINKCCAMFVCVVLFARAPSRRCRGIRYRYRISLSLSLSLYMYIYIYI